MEPVMDPFGGIIGFFVVMGVIAGLMFLYQWVKGIGFKQGYRQGGNDREQEMRKHGYKLVQTPWDTKP